MTHRPAIFSTAPQSRDSSPADYPAQVLEVAHWSEEAGCQGMLIYTDNGLLDPWLVSALVLANTERLVPLVAVQPAYMHPYSVAKMVCTLGYLHGRRVDLNLVAGGFRGDLLALGDTTAHDDRYERVVEFTRIVKGLLDGETVSLDGSFYSVSKLRLTPELPRSLMPKLFISGSSPAGLRAAELTGATAVGYPGRAEEELLRPAQPGASQLTGLRVGIITRPSAEQAWTLAHERFPDDRKGQLAHAMAMKASDSIWHRRLSELGAEARTADDPYWLWPFENYATFCPYLVGDHQRVAGELRRYMQAGYRSFIMDIPACEEDLRQIGTVFDLARAGEP